MRNFYEIDGKNFFNVSTYIKSWEKYIGIYNKEGAENKEITQSLASHAKNLWIKFNQDRQNLEKHYMESSSTVQSYIASFLLPNIERVFSILVKDENISFIEKQLLKNNDELIITDFGCGPLSGSVGVLALLEYILSRKKNIVIPKKIIIYAIDRSEKIVEAGTNLIKNSKFTDVEIVIEKITSPEKITKQPHIVLCINIFNEIPIKHRLKTLMSLYLKTNPEGVILILEPAQEEHSKALGNLRDDFIKNVDDCDIISPCTHKKQCPLSSNTNRKDWCWFRHAWNPPNILSQIDKFSNIDHYELNFSYLFLHKNKYFSDEKYFARCVSDEFLISHSTNDTQLNYIMKNLISGEQNEFLEMTKHNSGINKILLCTNSGDLESAFVIADPSQKPYRRGRKIKEKSELYMRAKERI